MKKILLIIYFIKKLVVESEYLRIYGINNYGFVFPSKLTIATPAIINVKPIIV